MAASASTTDLSTSAGERDGKSNEAGSAQRLDKLTLVDILRRGAAKFADRKMCATVQSVLAKICVCRTHVMGGRKFRCNECGEASSLYNSCGDRHCPACSGSKRFDFNARASKLLLPEANPQVVYYQVVCTLPSELSELALANQDEMADLLVGSAWKTLSKCIRQEQGYEPAAISVLHTWNQKLEAHRITDADEHAVTFLAREGTRVGGERTQVPITLSLRHFLQRWCLHILPEQLTKTRYWGGWSNNCREQYMARCRASLRQLGRLQPDLEAGETKEGEVEVTTSQTELPNVSAAASTVQRPAAEGSTPVTGKCPHCGRDALALVSKTPKPSWRDVFWRESETCPSWYAELQREEHQLYWTETYGADIYDCYLQWLVESAEEPETTSASKSVTEQQLLLPGLTLVTAYETIHF